MYRLGLALSAILVYATVAQAQTISVPTFVVDPGATINVTVTGTPGQNYALIGSITNSGFTFAGVNLSVGVDVVVLAFGVLDSAGQAVVPFRPPFPTRDRYYIQAATSTNPNFIPLSPGNSVSLINSELARLQIPVGGIITTTGAAAFLSSGVTVTRTGPGVYQIDHAGLLGIPTPVPNVTVIGGATITAIATNANRTVVTLSTDAAFFFTIQAVRR